MPSVRPNHRAQRLGKGLGAAALLFFLAKGLVWLAIAAAGYATLAS